MNKFIAKAYACLKSTDTIDQIIKIGIIFAFLFVGFFFEPFVIVGTSLLILIIAFENNIKSFYHIIFFFPTGVAFYYNSVDIFYFVSMFFMVWHLVKYILSMKFKVHKDWLFISVLAFCLFLVISQLIGKANYDRVGMIAHLLFIVYICAKNIDKLNLKYVAISLAAGILLSSFFGLFVNLIPKLTNLIISYDRFPGLMANPNSFYTLVLAALASICVLCVRRQINIYLFWGLFAVLTLVGLSTLSRAFILLYVLLAAGFVFCNLWQIRKKKIPIRKIAIFAGCIIVAFLIAYLTPQFRKVVDRLILTLRDAESLGDPIRFSIWESYVTSWLSSAKNIIFGIGFAPPIGLDGLPVTTAHNAALVLLCQTGIIGTLMFCTVIFFLLKSTGRNFKLESFLPVMVLIGFCMVETAIFKFQFYLFLIIILLCMTKKQNINNKTSI